MVLFNPLTITVLLIIIVVVISVLGGFIWLISKGVIKNSLETEIKVNLGLNEAFEKILTIINLALFTVERNWNEGDQN